MSKVLIISTSRKTRGGITAVLKLYEQSEMWRKYHCHWIGTHRDGNSLRKIYYFVRALVEFFLLLPFYDIVHIHFSLQTSAKRKYLFFKLAKMFGKITVIHLHCGSQIDGIWNLIYQKMFEQCDCGILLSESLKHKVEDRVGKSEKLKVVYNPCPMIYYNGIFEKTNSILFSGTLYEEKGYKDLIYAFSKIAFQYPTWHLVLVGNGEIERAKNLSRELNIGKQVELLGWVSGDLKHKIFSQAKALCLPSYAEGFPMAVLDAWAYGLPVITTPVGGIPDVAVNGENMLLFEPGDIDALSVCLERMITDDNLRLKLAKESQQLASTKFHLDTICNQLGELYEELLR